MEMATHSSRKADICFYTDLRDCTYLIKQCLITWSEYLICCEALTYPWSNEPNHFHNKLLAKNIFHARKKNAFNINVSKS